MSKTHVFNSQILREYDIRGVVGESLVLDDADAVGKAFGTIVQRKNFLKNNITICVGYDGRISSPEFEAAVVEGLKSTGVHVIRVGIGPTPMLYYAVHSLGANGGVMITGSHNPSDNNGFKFMLGKQSFFGKNIKDLGVVASQGDYIEGRGSDRKMELLDNYVDSIAMESVGLRPLKVSWDAGNGAAGEAMKLLTIKLPGKHILLNEQIDGTFPAHHPDPTVPKNLIQLIDSVQSQECDLGIAFDGDGDRIGIVDGNGDILWGDQILSLLSRQVLREAPGSTIIADVKASQVLFDEIERMGGVPLMWMTGHSLIRSKMLETGSPLAGEMSGHIFFADRYFGFDDALYAAVRILRTISDENQSLAKLRVALPQRVNTPEIRFDCEDSRKFEVIKNVRDRLLSSNISFNDIDGVRVNTVDGWWLLRASNTQPMLVARCESESLSGLNKLKQQLASELERCGVYIPNVFGVKKEIIGE